MKKVTKRDFLRHPEEYYCTYRILDQYCNPIRIGYSLNSYNTLRVTITSIDDNSHDFYLYGVSDDTYHDVQYTVDRGDSDCVFVCNFTSTNFQHESFCISLIVRQQGTPFKPDNNTFYYSPTTLPGGGGGGGQPTLITSPEDTLSIDQSSPYSPTIDIRDGAVTETYIADNAVTTDKISDNNVTWPKIGPIISTDTGNIITTKTDGLYAEPTTLPGGLLGGIPSEKLFPNTVGEAKDLWNKTSIIVGDYCLVNNDSEHEDHAAFYEITAITGSGDSAVLTWTFLAEFDFEPSPTYLTSPLGTLSIGGGDYDLTVDIRDGAVIETYLADGNVTTDKLNDNAVTMGKLSNNAVTTSKLNDNAVTTGKLSNDAVTTDKILDFNVTTKKIAPSAVNETKIADYSISNQKLGIEAVGTSNIRLQAITTPNLADNVITPTQLANVIDTTKTDNVLQQSSDGLYAPPSSGGEPTIITSPDNTIVVDQTSEYQPHIGLADGAVTTPKLADIIDTTQTDNTLTQTTAGLYNPPATMHKEGY